LGHGPNARFHPQASLPNSLFGGREHLFKLDAAGANLLEDPGVVREVVAFLSQDRR